MFRATLIIAGIAILAYTVVVIVLIPALAIPLTPERQVAGGDPARGRRLIGDYGCGSCHTIPGVRGANALVGPPLNVFARRSYIAGQLDNTPENLITWIRNPQEVEPGTAMPDLGVTGDDARDIAAYLYSLDRRELRPCLYEIRFWACS